MAQTNKGARLIAAQRIGLTLAQYDAHVADGEKWCVGCKTWHPRDIFAIDRSRGDGLSAYCRESRNLRARERHAPVPVESRKRRGPLPAEPRDGDARQARARINVLVRTGRLAKPNDLPCVGCGHMWTEGERRHEYDHHRGYAAEHHLTVEVVCSACHHARHPRT